MRLIGKQEGPGEGWRPSGLQSGLPEVCLQVSFFSRNRRILDLGFEKTITVILNAINAECQERQNVLLSATLTDGERREWVQLPEACVPLALSLRRGGVSGSQAQGEGRQ